MLTVSFSSVLMLILLTAGLILLASGAGSSCNKKMNRLTAALMTAGALSGLIATGVPELSPALSLILSITAFIGLGASFFGDLATVLRYGAKA